jgi:hypothetical protein
LLILPVLLSTIIFIILYAVNLKHMVNWFSPLPGPPLLGLSPTEFQNVIDINGVNQFVGHKKAKEAELTTPIKTTCRYLYVCNYGCIKNCNKMYLREWNKKVQIQHFKNWSNTNDTNKKKKRFTAFGLSCCIYRIGLRSGSSGSEDKISSSLLVVFK